MSILPERQPVLAVVIFLISALTFFHGRQNADAATPVSGRYLSVTGTSVVLSLTIQTSTPINLIVEQSLLPVNNIIATSPPAKKIDAVHGEAKWLFRNTRSGNITISIQLKGPLQGNPSAVVLYRTPNSAVLTKLRIAP